MEEARGPFSVLFLFFLENVIIGREIRKWEMIEKANCDCVDDSDVK